MREVPVPSLRPGDIVVMDNLGAHKNELTLALIEQAGAQTRFLPAYSPDLNPIEMMWSKVKALLRKAQARNHSDLLAAIASALNAVTPPQRRPRLVCPLRIQFYLICSSGVPVAFVALPDFKKRIARYVEQLDWGAAQITDIIARENVLPPELAAVDFELLVARMAPQLSARSKTLIASAEKGQRGAQYVTDVIRVAEHTARKAGRAIPNDDDVADAVGSRPQFQTESIAPAFFSSKKNRASQSGRDVNRYA